MMRTKELFNRMILFPFSLARQMMDEENSKENEIRIPTSVLLMPHQQ